MGKIKDAARGIKDYGDRGIRTYQRGPNLGNTLGAPVRSVVRPFQWTIFGVLKVVSLIISIFLIVSIFLFVYNGFTKGEIVEKIDIAISNMGYEVKLASFFDKYYQLVGWDSAKGPEGVFGFEGQVEETEADIGISIEEFKVREKKVYTHEPIFASAKINVGKIPPDREIKLNLEEACSLEEYQLKDPGVVSATPLSITLTENTEGRIIDVRCEFPEGIVEDGMLGKEQDTKKITFSPSFTYPNHDVTWYPFTKSFLESKDEVKIASWSSKEGPAKLTLGSSSSQPFYERERGYILYVNIKSSWQGYILKINNIEIEPEMDITLDTSSPYCDFESIGNKYRLKQEKINEANKDCTSTTILRDLGRFYKGGAILTYSECLDKIKKDFTFECPFEVMNAEEVASKTRIKARASYIFQMVNAVGVTVYRGILPDENIGSGINNNIA